MEILRDDGRANQRETVVELRSDRPFNPKLIVPALIPPGEYELSYCGNRLMKQFDRGVLVVWFEVDEFPEIFLGRYYNVTLLGKGSFLPKPCSDLVDEFRALFPRPLRRLDQVPLDWFERYGPRYLGNVATVSKNARGKLRPDETQYSKIESLIRRL